MGRQGQEAETFAEAWTREYAAFINGGLPLQERYDAIRRGYERCFDWIQAHPAPFEPKDKADIAALSAAMAMGQRLANGYVKPARAIEIHRAWFEWLTEQCADGAHERMFADEFVLRVKFVIRHGSLASLESLLSDKALQRIELQGQESVFRQQRIIRADARRTRGAFRDALEDLEIAKAHLQNSKGEMSSEGRGAYEAVALKVAIDLGMLDRASNSLEHLRQLAEDQPKRSYEKQRFQCALARYHLANGHFQRAMEVASEVLPEGVDIANLRLNITGYEAMALAQRAYALSRLAELPQERKAAAHAIRHELLRARTDQATLVPLTIELAAILFKSEDQADKAEAYSVAASVLPQLKEGQPSTLSTARTAAELYRIVKGMGRPDETERARLFLEVSAMQLVHSWRDIGRVDGGIGFLEFPGRRAAVSTWIDSRLHSPGGAEYALQGLLEIDRCSQLTQSLAARHPDSPALSVEVKNLVNLAREHQGVFVWFLSAPELTHRFTVSPGGVRHDAIEPLAAFHEPIEQALHWLRRRPAPGQEFSGASAAVKNLSWLAKELLPEPFSPAAQKLRGQDVRAAAPALGKALPSLWLTGLDAFGHTPFEVLPSASGQPLGLSVPVVRLPSLTCAVHAAMSLSPKGTGAAEATFEVFSPPMKGHPSGDISLRMDEIMALRKIGQGRARYSLTRGPAATRAGFGRALRSGAQLLVAWTHGRYDSHKNRPAGLEVTRDKGDDGEGFALVDASFVEKVLGLVPEGLMPRAVYLAACDVARGHRRVGDTGASHLGGAFLGSGVPVIVASSERNDREATSVHLRAFAAAFVRDGATAEEAILRARIRVSETAPFAHPHFWAGLQLLGWGPTTRR